MKCVTIILFLALLVFTSSPFTALSQAEDNDADARNEANLKLLRYRAQQYQDGNTRNRFLEESTESDSNNSCGSINIGNIDNLNGTLRENIIIIDGDIINADNYCK